LKISNIIHVYKNGEKNIFANFRPISLLTNFSKNFVKLIYSRLINYLSGVNVPSKNQFGFQKNKSTVMAALEMIDKITNAFDATSSAIGIFVDLAKAFDTVNYEILFSKLSHYGVRGQPWNLLINYLENRKQYVSFNNVSSGYCDITCGIPQGSILGPLLILLYVDDMKNCSQL